MLFIVWQVKLNQARIRTVLILVGGMWPHWELYKEEVAQREGFYLHLGQAVVQVVEDCGIEDWAECVCCEAYAEEDPLEWDFAVEDIMGESDSFGKAVFAVYWSKLEHI